MVTKTRTRVTGLAGTMAVLLLFSSGCSPESPKKTASKPAPAVAEGSAEDGPDETTVALEEQLAAKQRSPGSRTKKPSARTNPPPVAKPIPGPGEQLCFGCDGTSRVPCGAPGCKGGKVDCPGPCVTRSEGTWVPDPKVGAAPGSMAFILRFPGVKSTWYVNEFHAGEVWALENGKLVSKGYCPTCGGSRWLTCKNCEGGGLRTCPVCEGKALLPASWKATDNPWFNRQPDVVRLKDGRAFLGRDAGGDDVIVMFRTQAGETLSVPREDVVQWPKSSQK